ncbi:MAG: hypothetical protein F9K40_15370 [Kofleriaceae bacterium]|nr:MAG: hypothetical protein F9K40_15370 [Kofleriaceae bacterium]MBZ0231659.1 E3 ubiquitin ligase family protein [Kofleriaceae bacterium]
MPPPDDDDDEPDIRKLGDAVPGRWLKVVGTVVACEGAPLVAPLTGRRCVAFDAAIFQYVLEPHPTFDAELYTGGQLLTRSLRAVPFFVEDATGRALVDPRGAFVRLTLDHEQGGPGQRIDRLVVADHAFLPRSRPNEDKRYVEGVLEIGELVLVSGFVQKPEASADASVYRASADPRVRIAGSPGLPADITDRRDEVERAGGPSLARMREMTPGARVRQHVSGRMIIVPDD